MVSAPPPGWYDDPGSSGQQRWWDGAQWTEQMSPPQENPVQHQQGRRYEYRCVQVRERWAGQYVDAAQVEQVLNENAAAGWQLKAITSADVAGRLAGAREGVLLTFERPT